MSRGYSRRHISRIALGAAAVIPFFSEAALAQQSDDEAAATGAAPAGGRGGRGARGGSGSGRGGFGGGGRGVFDPDVIRISSNENPMGPSKEGIEAMAKVGPLGWRYQPQGENNDFQSELLKSENVKNGYAVGYPGSSIPLANAVAAFAGPDKPWVMGDPGYGAGNRWVGAKVIPVPLRKDYTHDVQAMVKASPNAGAYYICNPNNPTSTLTPMKDFEYLLANKPKDAVLIIDEAYVHFAGPDNYSTELVRQDKDVVVLRTFSKAYGMAGLRCGATFGRPDLLQKISQYGGTQFLPVTATACAAASMKANPGLMKDRMELCKQNRDLALEHIQKMGQSYIPNPMGNFFMLQVKGMTGAQVGTAFGAKKIQLASAQRWPSMPNFIRVTVGTKEEMTKFNTVLDQVLQEGPPKAVAQAG